MYRYRIFRNIRVISMCLIAILVMIISNQRAFAGSANYCETEYAKYLTLPIVFKAFATSAGVVPNKNNTEEVFCGAAGRSTLQGSKTAAVKNCETERKKAGDPRRCILIDAKSQSVKLAKNDCDFVLNWYNKFHPGYTVLATTGGMKIVSSAIMGCSAQFEQNLASAKRVAINSCNKQSKLRGLPANCRIIQTKHSN